MENCNPVLAFDCSTTVGSVAVLAHGQCHVHTLPQGKQAALLVPTIEALLAQARTHYGEVERIVTTLGPGSFTGLRVALATAHGLHLARNIPLHCTSSLTALAAQFFAHHAGVCSVIAFLNAGKGEVFWQRFEASPALPCATSEITLIRQEALPEALANQQAIGNIACDHAVLVEGVDAGVLCRLAPLLPQTPIHMAMPHYIRPPDAKIPAIPAWLASPAN